MPEAKHEVSGGGSSRTPIQAAVDKVRTSLDELEKLLNSSGGAEGQAKHEGGGSGSATR